MSDNDDQDVTIKALRERCTELTDQLLVEQMRTTTLLAAIDVWIRLGWHEVMARDLLLAHGGSKT